MTIYATYSLTSDGIKRHLDYHQLAEANRELNGKKSESRAYDGPVLKVCKILRSLTEKL